MLKYKNLLLFGCWLVLVLVAYFSGTFFWTLYEPTQTPEKAQRVYQPITSSAKKAKPPRKPPSDIRTILAANLFGNDRGVKQPVKSKQTVDAPETRLKFELQGIFVSTNEAQTRALIAEKGKPAYPYKKSDELPGNVIVDSILEDRVLLRRAGRLETLSFPKERAKGGSKRSKKNQGMLTYHPQNSATKVVSESKRAYYKNPVKSFANYGLEMDDEADGLRLSGSGNSKLLERAGLKKGDLIRSVNGKSLSDFKADQNLVDEVVASGELSVEIERGGQPIILSLPIP